MKPNKIIKTLMKQLGFTNQSLADKLGKSHASAISNTLSRTNGMRIDTFLEMVNTMGYKVIVVPENTIVLDDSFVIDENTEELSQADKKSKSNRIKLTNVNEKQSKTLDELLNT